MSAAASGTPAPRAAVPLTFWQWLKSGCPNNQAGVLTAPLASSMMIVAAAISGIALDWLFPMPDFDGTAREGRSGIDILVLPPLLGGFCAWASIFIAAPRGGRDTAWACLLALLVAAVAQAGMMGSFAVASIFVDISAAGFWILSAVAIAGMLPGFAALLGVAWRFYMPVPAAPPPPLGVLEIVVALCITLPVSFAAAFGFFAAAVWFAYNVPWPATGACGLPIGIFGFGLLSVELLGIEAAKAWRLARAQRGALLLRCGEALTILLAGAVLGQFAGCGERWMGGGFIDWDSVSAMFGGSSLLVFIAAYWLAALRMDRFLTRHGLRRQDRGAAG